MTHLLLAVMLAAAPPVAGDAPTVAEAVPIQYEAKLLGNQSVIGSAVTIEGRQIAMVTPNGSLALDPDKLIWIVQKPAPDTQTPPKLPMPMHVELIDGSSFRARQYAVAEGKARIALADLVIELPTTAVTSVRLMPSSEEVAAEWSKIAGQAPEADVLVIRKEKAIDYHKGGLGDVSDETVKFNLDGDVLPVKRSKVYGLVYCHPKSEALPEAICRITDATGSQWSVSEVGCVKRTDKPDSGAFHAPYQLRWTTPTGAKVTSPLVMISKIDFSSGKVVYLGDLEPESSEFTPFFGSADDLPMLTKFYAPRSDKNMESAPLSIDGRKKYDKGLALHSRTRLVYRLPGRFSRFKAVVGIDAGVRPLGHVRLLIRGDDKVLLEADVTGSDPPKPIDLDVTGVRRISILADFGEKLDVGDHLDLCEARILK